MSKLSVLSSGVDTLHLSVRGCPDEDRLYELDEAKEQARVSSEQQVVSFTDPPRSFLMRPHGWRRYRLWMSSPSFELALGASDPFPFSFVQLHSAFIHTAGVAAAVEDVRDLLGGIFSGEPDIAVSRIDLYVDQQGWIPTRTMLDDFVCRAVQRRAFDQTVTHTSGRQLTGFVFGKGDVVARIYNKSAETSAKGSTWQEKICHDRDPRGDVWRIEFQFRSAALRRWGLSTPDEVIAARQKLWEYATTWLSLRARGAHQRQARWQTAPEWMDVQAAHIGDPSGGALIARELEAADQIRLIRGFVGYASALAARERPGNDDLGAGLTRIAPHVRRYLSERDVSFEEIVARKRNAVLGLLTPRATDESAEVAA